MFERWEVGGATWDDIRTIYALVFIALLIAMAMIGIAQFMGIVA